MASLQQALLQAGMPRGSCDEAAPWPAGAVVQRHPGSHCVATTSLAVRAQLLLQSASRAALHSALGSRVPLLAALPEARGVRWSVAVDPGDLFERRMCGAAWRGPSPSPLSRRERGQ